MLSEVERGFEVEYSAQLWTHSICPYTSEHGFQWLFLRGENFEELIEQHILFDIIIFVLVSYWFLEFSFLVGKSVICYSFSSGKLNTKAG